MKKLFPILAMSLTLLISACTKPDEPTQKRFSILGDSYSTFTGYVTPETNDIWPYEEIGLNQPSQMWWWQVADSTSWVLEQNNSFSGSLICNMNASNYYGPHSFIRRMNDLGNPDVIFILGATNDVWNNAPFGDYVYADWTEEQLCSYRPALAYLLDNMLRLYPNATIYFLLETNPCPGGITEETRLNLIESTHNITNHYNVPCIDLNDIHKTQWHPDEIGQRSMAQQVLDYLMTEVNV